MKNTIKNFCSLFIILTFALACGNSEPVKEPVEEVKEEAVPPPVVLAKSNTGHPQMDVMVDSLFSAFKSSSKENFQKVIPGAKEIEALYFMMIPPEADRDYVRQKMKEDNIVEKERKMITELFELALKRGKEQSINWEGILLTSVSIDSSEENRIKMFSGEIGFTENDRDFKMKFSDCMITGKRMVLTSIAIPLEDKGRVNLAWNNKYKKSYIRRCVESEKKHSGLRQNGMSPEAFCECSFNTLAKREYGEENLKDTTRLYTDGSNCK